MSSYVLQFARKFPSTSYLLSMYASLSTMFMLLRNVYNEMVPKEAESFVISRFSKVKRYFFRNNDELLPDSVTLIIDESWSGFGNNKLVKAAKHYLSKKIGPNNKIIRVGRFDSEKLTPALVEGGMIVDTSKGGVEVRWEYVKENKDGGSRKRNKPYFKLSFENKSWKEITEDYLIKEVLKEYREFKQGERIKKLENIDNSVDFLHPSTFDTLAMDSELKEAIIADLKRFQGRKDFYKRVGKAWKRGYLLYGPPGTGKSSLIAAMANYLNFDVYDLQLSDIYSDSSLRSTLLDIDSKTIVVIEDIDCHSVVHDRSKSDGSDYHKAAGFTLSSLLNCIDGLWSSCGEERIFVFTTNHKDVLDPALLRPGRMDMHIHMSYCTTQGFRILASNYLGIKEHQLFEEIDSLLQTVEATPASLAQELLTSSDPDVALGEVVNFLKQKKIEKEKLEKEQSEEKEKMEVEKENNEEEQKDMDKENIKEESSSDSDQLSE